MSRGRHTYTLCMCGGVKKKKVMREMLREEKLRTRGFVRTHHLKRALFALTDTANLMKRCFFVF